MATDVVFPYGTFPVDPLFRAYYERDYSCASTYPLPDRLPYHHPLLRSLEGTYPLTYTLPPWWQDCVAQVWLEQLKPLLATISAQEFREGCIAQSRWKAFREGLPEVERRQLPSSPKIAGLIGATTWLWYFEKRGPATTPDQLILSISTNPLDFLYMSNGQDWRSCLHFRLGSENHHLPGNFYDTNVAIATVLAPTTCIRDEGAVLARTTLRLFLHQGQPMVAIGRTYHNNETVALLLLRRLADLFDARQLSWGFIVGVNATNYSEEGVLGPELFQRLKSTILVDSEPFFLPRDWHVPYVDGEGHYWDRDYECECEDYHRLWLSATVKPMRPVPSHLPMQTQDTLAQPSSAGTIPQE